MTQSLILQIRNKILVLVLTISFFVILALHLAKPINLAAVDIGRHIINGQLILSGNTDILHKNYYSFTHPDYPFINHHWFFGVAAYLIFNAGGFLALSIVYIAMLLAALFLCLRTAFLRGHKEIALLVAFLALPLIFDRGEIRPEGFSMLMMSLYLYFLTKLSLGRINFNIVFIVLVVLQAVWVNTHIFFFMGPVLVGFFLWEGKSRGCCVCVRQLRPLLAATFVINILNPSGIAGMLTPLNAFQGFGYRLAENQNVFFMRSFFPEERGYLYAIGLLGLGIGCIGYALWSKNRVKHLPFVTLLLLATIAGAKAVRLMPFFALFLMTLGSYFFAKIYEQWPHVRQKNLRLIMLVLALFLMFFYLGTIKYKDLKLGLYPKVNASAEFYKVHHIQGPILSNYDIGGYLIYHLSSYEKVFVDNRQEAFPQDFFKDVYIKMQNDANTWAQVDAQYHFNVIYFYRHDLTEWGQNFLLKRIDDPSWAPVFVDDYTIIFLKRNIQNAPIINQFELPRSMFGVKQRL